MKNIKGKNKGDAIRRLRIIDNKIKDSYSYKLISRFISVIFTIILIFLLVIGSLLFYFNMKSKSYTKEGKTYVPPFGLYTIVSGSMEPNIHVYDVVVSAKENDLDNIKVGDIITFVSTWDVNYGLTVTHRVVSVSKTDDGEYQFTTKGDNNQAPDGAVVTQKNLVGKVIMRIPQLGRLQFFLATKLGWLIVVLIPALIVIIYDAIKIFKLVVLKNRLDNVADVDDADHIYFGTEYLDNRALSEDALDKTRKMVVLNHNSGELPELSSKKNKGALEKPRKRIIFNRKKITKRR